MPNQDLIELPEIPHGLRIYNTPPQFRLEQIIARQQELIDGPPMDDAAKAEFDMLKGEFDMLMSHGPGRQAEPQNPSNNVSNAPMPNAGGHHPATGGYQSGASADTGGWQSFGHFAAAVRTAAANGGRMDPRLVTNAPTTTSSEGIGSDGGFAVPPQWRAEIWQKVNGENSMLPFTDGLPNVFSNTIVSPADEGSPWGSTGPQAYFESEAGQMTQSKVALTDKTIRLNKLTALVPVTEELLEDAPGLDSYLRRTVGGRFDFKLNLKIVQGQGAGEPLGILNSPSVVSVAKESGQTADTIVTENLFAMFSRLYAPCQRNAVFLAHQTTMPELFKLHAPIQQLGTITNNFAAVAAKPLFLPTGNINGGPQWTLMGRPILFSEALEPLGDKGDIILVDLKQYMTAVKGNGVRTDVSIHLWFDYDVMAYRFILRVAGQPWWAAPITSRDGSTTYSWAVTLDERA